MTNDPVRILKAVALLTEDMGSSTQSWAAASEVCQETRIRGYGSSAIEEYIDTR
jgi:hypothetical protein